VFRFFSKKWSEIPLKREKSDSQIDWSLNLNGSKFTSLNSSFMKENYGTIADNQKDDIKSTDNLFIQKENSYFFSKSQLNSNIDLMKKSGFSNGNSSDSSSSSDSSCQFSEIEKNNIKRSGDVVELLEANENMVSNSKSSKKVNLLEEPLKNEDLNKRSKSIDLRKINSIPQIVEYIKNFNGCDLKKRAKNTVVFSGPANAKLMIIGEGPGAEEDEEGLPFVGASGKLLNKMLEAIGINRDNVFVTNIVFWRPPGNRAPTNEEIELCFPMLEKEIEIVKPKCILILGSSAMKTVLKTKEMISRMREGQIHNYKDIPCFVTFHPSYLLRLPKQKSLTWFDLQRLEEFLKTNNIDVNNL